MKYYLFVLLSLLITTSIQAQSQHSSNHQYHEFEAGEKTYLLADNVNVRATASSKAKVVANLPIGTAVEIVSNSYKTLTLNGFEANWYEVKFGEKSGYVWGGLIAEGFLTAADDKNTLFLYGIASVKKDKPEWGGDELVDHVKLQVRASKNNKEISKLTFKAPGGLEIGHWAENYGNKGFDAIKDIIYITVSQQMCAGLNADMVLFWDGAKLTYITELNPGGDAPYFYSDELIFPTDEGGKKGEIFGQQMSGEYDEVNETDIIEEHRKVAYKWTGTKLVQTKVLIDKKSE